MAAATVSNKGSLREDLTCAICCDLFREPVMLPCTHHFCKSCISRYWRTLQGPVTCPQCRKPFSTKQFQNNYLVTAVVEKVRITTSDSRLKHLEKRLKDSLERHCLRKEDFINIIHRDYEKMDAIKRAGAELRSRVQVEFRAMQQLLQEEQERVLEQLRREQDEALAQLQHHLDASKQAVRDLEHRIGVLQQAAAASDGDAMAELPQLSRQRVQEVMVPEFDMNAFSAKYMAPLQYITWRKMFNSLKPGPAPLTFDVKTAHPSVYVSRDKTIAVESNIIIPYKHLPKRFIQCVNILASQGFQSGRHYWEVGVGSKPKWDLGVASEGVDRQARVRLSPDSGYWTLRLRSGSEYFAGTQPWTRLQLGSSPQRIGVFLDCEERRVSFYNADDMGLIYSFSNGPQGKVFPFFSPCIHDNGQPPQPIQLLHYPPVNMSV